MAKKDFDDLNKVIRVDLDSLDSTSDSIEIDLELPRGFVARLNHTRMGVSVNTNNLISGDDLNVQMALIRDPDDGVTVSIPLNQTQHDVITDMDWRAIAIAPFSGAADVSFHPDTTNPQEKDWGDNFQRDMITARNLRFNAVGISGMTNEVNARARVDYTLEEVDEEQLINVLDIL